MSSEDLRVPTFITYEPGTPASDKKLMKRKRPTKENKPNKKKKAVKAARKIGHAPKSPLKDTVVEEPAAKQIWIGAIVEKDRGAFSVYFGQGDDRNCSEIFDKENELQDLDYASLLGTKKAAEITKHAEEPFIVNTFCRILPRALAGRTDFIHYKEIVSQIRDIINHKGYALQVCYVSGRTPSSDQKAAMNLAAEAFLQNDEPTDMEVDNVDNLNIGNLNQQIAKEEQDVIAITASNEQTLSAIAAASVHGDDTSVALETDDKKVVDEIVEDALAVATEVNQEAVGGALDSTDSSTDVVVETTIETKVETKVEVRLLSPEEAEALCINVERTQKIEETNHTETMVDIEETEQEAEAAAAVTTSSWASAFGIKSLFDVLSSPFRSRKSSS